MLKGASIAQVIPIISYIFLAKIVGTIEFGIFSIWLGFVYLGAVLCTLRLENSLVIESDGKHRNNSFIKCVTTLFIISSFLFLLIVILLSSNISFINKLPIISWLLLVPSFTFLAINTTLQSLAAADGEYKNLNRLRIIQSSSVVITQLCFVYLFAESKSLMLGFLVGQIVCIAFGIYNIRNRFDFKINIRSIFNYVRKHWKFPTFSLPADGLSTLGAMLPVTFVGSIFGLDSAGQLALTMRVLGAPVGLLGKAIQDVFKRHAMMDIKKNGECKKLYLSIFVIMQPIIITFLLIVYFGSELFFIQFFGVEWANSAKFAKILCFVFGLSFVASPLSYIVYIIGKQYVDLIWQVVLVLLIIISFFTIDDLFISLIIYSVSYSVLYIIYLFISFYLCSIQHKIES